MADGEDGLRDDPDELAILGGEWEAIFGESMPWGFGIGEDQIPMLCQCIAKHSREPLKAYIATIPLGTFY